MAFPPPPPPPGGLRRPNPGPPPPPAAASQFGTHAPAPPPPNHHRFAPPPPQQQQYTHTTGHSSRSSGSSLLGTLPPQRNASMQQQKPQLQPIVHMAPGPPSTPQRHIPPARNGQSQTPYGTPRPPPPAGTHHHRQAQQSSQPMPTAAYNHSTNHNNKDMPPPPNRLGRMNTSQNGMPPPPNRSPGLQQQPMPPARPFNGYSAAAPPPPQNGIGRGMPPPNFGGSGPPSQQPQQNSMAHTVPSPMNQTGMVHGGGYPPPPNGMASSNNMPPPPPNQPRTSGQIGGHPPPGMGIPSLPIPPSMAGNSGGGGGHQQGYPPPPPAGGMGTGSGRGYPAPQQYQDQPKIDPSQIPRPPLFTQPQQDDGGTVPVYYPHAAIESSSSNSNAPALLPPPADTRYTVQDDGNASPDTIRSSVYAFPIDRTVWHQTGDIPLGILSTPLASHSQDYRPRPRSLVDGVTTEPYTDPQVVPVLLLNNNGNSGGNPNAEAPSPPPPPRCSQCSAYVNFYFGSDGTCNLCRSKNRALSGSNYNNSDSFLRGAGPSVGGPAVPFGTVEYNVHGPYVTRTAGPVQAVSLYAMDLTDPQAATLSYATILSKVGLDMAGHYRQQRQFHMGGTQPAPPRIGVCLVSCLGIVVRETTTERFVIMPDVTEAPYSMVPLSEWTYDLSTDEGVAAWQSFCDNELRQDIAEWRQAVVKHKNPRGADGLELSCGGAALEFLSDALEQTGGRGTYLSWRRPNFGIGTLPLREAHSPRDDSSLYTPLQLLTVYKNKTEEESAAFYKNVGARCVKNRVSLDVVMQTPASGGQPMELATLGEVCKVTCGKLSWIRSTGDWQNVLKQELTQQVQSFTGWDAVFKVRCSEGIRVKKILASGGLQFETLSGGSSELELSSVSPSTCIGVELEHRVGGINKTNDKVYIQTALLYTTMTGKRRVRVSTLAIRTTSVVNDVYRSVDFGAMTSLLTRSVVDCLRNYSTDEGTGCLRTKSRDLVYNRCIAILSSYRKHTPAKNSPLGQLILPEKMQLLPLYCMGMLKSPMLRPGLPRRIAGMQAASISPTCDERALFTVHAGQALPSLTMLLLYPNVFCIGDLSEADGVFRASDEVGGVNGFVPIPPTIRPSIASLADDGAYLIDDGRQLFIYVGRLAPDSAKQALLNGEPCELKNRVDALIFQMRVHSSTTRGSESELRPTWAPTTRVLQQEGHQSPIEADVLNLMVADATPGEKDYVDFLCSLHKQIRATLSA